MTITINNTADGSSTVGTSVNIPPNQPLDFGTLSTLFQRLTPQASPPGSPSAGDVYYDDGSNTVTGVSAFRRYTGSAWEDVTMNPASDIYLVST